jgi:hypothetical protein
MLALDFRVGDLFIYVENFLVEVTGRRIYNGKIYGRSISSKNYPSHRIREDWGLIEDFKNYHPIKKSDLILYTNWEWKSSRFWELLEEK